MKNSILRMYAVTPCHAGSGSALGVVDLPIQRERHTNWPMIQASGMKGAMRVHFERNKSVLGDDHGGSITEYIFGSESKESAGAFSVSDAKILAFPMRSNVAPFVWITCPSVLERLSKDIKLAGKTGLSLTNINPKENEALWVNGDFTADKKVFLEDMEVSCVNKADLSGDEGIFSACGRLLIVNDAIFNYGVSQCTQIMAQIKIDQSSGTTADGSLRYQEELPADTVMYCLLRWGDSKSADSGLKADQIKEFFETKVMKDYLQAGGDESLGRGIFELSWIEGGK